MTKQLAALLLAVRACCVALVAAIDAFDAPEEVSETNADGSCAHPETNRTPVPTMGYPERYLCKRCNALVMGDKV